MTKLLRRRGRSARVLATTQISDARNFTLFTRSFQYCPVCQTGAETGPVSLQPFHFLRPHTGFLCWVKQQREADKSQRGFDAKGSACLMAESFNSSSCDVTTGGDGEQ